MHPKPTIAIIGGTGDLGTGLARRCAAAGYRTIIGSRTQGKAQSAAEQLRATLLAQGVKMSSIDGADNLGAARLGDIVFLTVPFGSQLDTLSEIRSALDGKILVDVTVPLVPPRVARVQLPAEGSAAQRSQLLLGDNVRVVSALQNVAAHHLNSEESIDCDVLVCGDDKDARTTVVDLIASMGMRSFPGGALANSAASDALTSVLIFINKQYGCHAGIRITGIDSHPEL